MQKFLSAINSLQRVVEQLLEGEEVNRYTIDDYLETCIKTFDTHFVGFLGYERVLKTLKEARNANNQQDLEGVIKHLKDTQLL